MLPLVKLNEYVYELKQGAHEWRILLDTTLKKLVTNGHMCPHLFIIIQQKVISRLVLGMYVDDILCQGTKPKNFLGFTNNYHQSFQSLSILFYG